MANEKTSGQNYRLAFAEILSHLRPNIASSARNKRWPIDRLIPYAKNSRTHSEAQIAQLAANMKEWGWTNPVLAANGPRHPNHNPRVKRASWLEASYSAHRWREHGFLCPPRNSAQLSRRW